MSGRSGTKSTSSSRHERRLLELIDKADTIKRYERDAQRMWSGALDPVGFLKAASADAAIHLADLMTNGETDRIKLDACKDVLDRAGYGSTSKVSVTGSMRVDHDTSKAELINMILSSAKQVGIEVKDDAPELLPLPEPTVIDAEGRAEDFVEAPRGSDVDGSDVDEL